MREEINTFHLNSESNKPAYLQAPLLSKSGLVDHAFSTRLGGLSTGHAAWLNTAFHVGDSSDNVLENRRLFFGQFGYDYRQIVSSVQVHGTAIRVFDHGNSGEGALPYTARRRCDALVTEAAGLPLTAYSADCQLIYFVSLENRPLVALAHAGWRGTLGNIGGKVVRFLKDYYALEPAALYVGLGPVICRCCYRVAEDTAALFREAGWGCKPYLEAVEEGGYGLDLNAINSAQLLGAGIKETRLARNGWCTSCRPDLFYSYRRDKGNTGRMLGFIALREK